MHCGSGDKNAHIKACKRNLLLQSAYMCRYCKIKFVCIFKKKNMIWYKMSSFTVLCVWSFMNDASGHKIICFILVDFNVIFEGHLLLSEKGM